MCAESDKSRSFYRLFIFHCESKTEKSKIYKLWKVDERIPILQQARSRSKKENKYEMEMRIEKDGKRNWVFTLGSDGLHR